MNIPDTIKTLTEYNAWRRDHNGDMPMFNPVTAGIAIDSAIKHLKELSIANAALTARLTKAENPLD